MTGRAETRVAIGPGRLVLIVGPSGAGKDTLIDLAKLVCRDDGSVVFPRRLVTREASAFEDNQHVSHDMFRHAVARGDYAVHWEAHGHGYALSRRIDDELRLGRTVIANVSRTVIATMRRGYDHVVVVAITAPPDVLAERLAARSRTSDGVIAQRLGRIVDDAAATPDHVIDNVGDAAANAARLVQIIRDAQQPAA